MLSTGHRHWVTDALNEMHPHLAPRKHTEALKVCRYCKAYKIACDRGVRKYFEHAGALITADGTGDELIKLEGMPKNYKFTF